jgi:hypothetical protein
MPLSQAIEIAQNDNKSQSESQRDVITFELSISCVELTLEHP